MPTQYAPNKSFDPELAELMQKAFEAAWQSLLQSHDVNAQPSRAAWARETLALRIIDTAQEGERDPDILRDDALAHLAHAESK
jgi:hypothetical protein